ncbi:MAG: alpha/beta hydrolase, partial [Xanthomonadales bacterium]|nr:alpha/beta hydrolase [Gammaproteobacteria bacterium]NNK05031.1 alpha/beta hydrolase [Xanthomonadales bacterium]
DTQRLDLHLADEPGRPLVICLHGGGFIGGDRNDERCRQAVRLLTEAGFSCASVSYSLAPESNRFAMWPRNLFDVADATSFLHNHAAEYAYNCSRFGMLGFSAGCCLANLYIQGGTALFRHFGYATPVLHPAALVGFYGPYDFPSRQPERRSDDALVNLYHSPSYWLRKCDGPAPPPVLHIQGDQDTIVYPDQHQAFKADCEQRGYRFKAIIAKGFGHSFAPAATNAAGASINLRRDITEFFERHLAVA